eukprot:gb/GEZJ01005128.1/.p1 GENE.gb/GEZJ01005128.1/~~gb/GEZJ01005128.1/.p1  ORF type:complete len:138 (-),score=6.55 gb/GEZJ01005128.1/:557-970(-)
MRPPPTPSTKDPATDALDETKQIPKTIFGSIDTLRYQGIAVLPNRLLVALMPLVGAIVSCGMDRRIPSMISTEMSDEMYFLVKSVASQLTNSGILEGIIASSVQNEVQRCFEPIPAGYGQLEHNQPAVLVWQPSNFF